MQTQTIQSKEYTPHPTKKKTTKVFYIKFLVIKNKNRLEMICFHI